MRKLYSFTGSGWTAIEQPHVFVDGIWQPVNHVYIFADGAWVKCYQKRFVFEANFTTEYIGTYVPRDAAITAGWNGIIPIQIIVNVYNGGFLCPPDVGSYSLVFNHTLPAGSEIRLNVYNGGYICGRGGAGGNGDQTTTGSFGTNGGNGGPAVYINQHAVIINNFGIISGGGGGGAGGSGQRSVLKTMSEVASISYRNTGGGGGGGAPYGAAGTAPTGGTSGYNGVNGDAGAKFIGGAGGFGASSIEPFTVQGGYPTPYYGRGSSGGNGGNIGNAGVTNIVHRHDYTVFAWDVVDGDTHTKLGGSPGYAVVGNQWVTWTNVGDVRGGTINS